MHSRAKAVSITGILAALSAILYVWPNIPIFPATFPMFKMNFADLPALLAGTIVSPLVGVAVVLIRCAIHLTISDTMFIGELSNFIVSSGFVLLASILITSARTSKSKLGMSSIVMVIASAFQVILAVFVNYYITMPLYGIADNLLVHTVVAGVIPFNSIKAVANSLIFLIVYHALVPKIRRFI